MPRPPRRRRFVAGLLLAPLLTGCFATGGTNGSSGSGSGLGGGARLRVALAFPPAENLSPYGADATLLSRLGVTEGLTTLDANGTAAPALAASWTRDSDRTWLFTLREATFQDGTEVTAAAVATALNKAAAAEPVPAALTGVHLTAKAAGDGRVRVTTGDPDPVLPLRLTSPGLVVLAPKAYGGTAVNPVGTATGPFEITKVTGTTAATLDRFDDYWGGRAQSAGVDVKFIADGTARTNALRTGGTDIAEAVPVSQAAALDRNVRHETATTRTTGLLLNTASGPLKNAGLRAAVRAALDTSALAEGVYEGYADPGVGIYGPAVTWAADARVQPTGRAAAKDADGTALTLATYTNRPELPEAAQVVERQLTQAGFTVKLVVREYSRLESDALDGRFDAVLAARNTLLDTGDPVSILASDYTCAGDYNLAQLCDSRVDKAVATAERAADTAERQRAALTAEAAILGTDAVVPLVHQRIITGIATTVRGTLLDPYERTLIGPGTRR